LYTTTGMQCFVFLLAVAVYLGDWRRQAKVGAVPASVHTSLMMFITTADAAIDTASTNWPLLLVIINASRAA